MIWWVVALVSVSLPVAAAVTALARPRLRPRLPAPAYAAAAVSAAVTLAYVTGTARPVPGAEALAMAESVALMTLAGLVVRHVPARRAAPAALAAGLASAVWLLRFFVPASPLEGVGAVAFWGLGALLAAAVGAHLRVLESRQDRALAGLRTDLRLRLAADLHDFVAHDISEMVAHAQAGRAGGDPSQALERVEAAGQRALAMLDRTLDTLRHDGSRTPPGDLDGIREAAERFSAAGPARVHLRMEPGVTATADTAALAYRVVIEGLTNVRRHAGGARRVELDVGAESGALLITLTNDGVRRARGGRRGGSGLPALTELVRAQGGELAARPLSGGWRLTARLPLAQSLEWPPASSSPTTRKASAVPSASSSTPSPT